MKIKHDTEFPRSWKYSDISFITQPYIIGIYVAGTKNKQNVFQGSISYNKLNAFIKQLKKDPETKDLYIAKIGSHMDESSLKILIEE